MLHFTMSIFEPAENLFMHVVFDSETGNLSQSFGLENCQHNDVATCSRVLLEIQLSS